MQFTRTIVVQNLLKYAWMSIKEQLDSFRVIIDSFRNIFHDPVQSGIWIIFDRTQISLMFSSTNV